MTDVTHEMPPEDPETDSQDDHDRDTPPQDEITPAEADPDNKIAGVHTNWNTDAEWDGHDYAEIPIPDEDERPRWEWSTTERRAWILSKLREYGTWDNVPVSQSQVGDQFNVPQQSISNDVKELRRYIRFHAGNKAISMTEMVAQNAVASLVDEEEHFKALQAQLDYNEWLFELGRLDRAPDKKQVHQINQEVTDESLDSDEQDHFQKLANDLERAQEARSDEIVVENKEDDD